MTEKQPFSLENLAPRDRYEQERVHLADLLERTNYEIAEYHHVLLLLMNRRRFEEYGRRRLEKYGFDPTKALKRQLYDLDYDQGLFFDALNTRDGGNANFHQEKEVIDPNSLYGYGISDIAQVFEFVGSEVATEPQDAFNRRLGMSDSRAGVLPRVPFEAVVPAGAGATNYVRLHDALENIRSGTINSSKIIVTACDRPLEEAEKRTLASFELPVAETEFDLAVTALNHLEQTTLDLRETQSIPVTFKTELPPKTFLATTREINYLQTTITVGDRRVEVTIVSAPFDPYRHVPGGDVAKRANTEETLVATQPFLSNEVGSNVVIISHDIWINAQKVIADEVFGVSGKRVFATGLRRLDRLTYDAQHGLVLNKPEAVIDEIAKTYRQLVELKTRILTRQAQLNNLATTM